MGDDMTLAESSKNSKRITHLLAEARKSFTTIGYQHVSIDGLSRSSGVSKETIYRHFEDKKQLFRAAMRDVVNEFSVHFTPLLRQDASPEKILLDCSHAIVARNLDGNRPNPSWLAVVVANSDPDLSHLVFGDYFQSLQPLRDYIASLSGCDKAGSSGLHCPTATQLVAQFGALAVGGLGYLMLPEDRNHQQEDAYASVDLFLHGALADGAGSEASLASPREFAMTDVDGPAVHKEHIAELMRVSRSHFYHSGYQASSLDQIGAEARVGRGTLYRHFKSKAGLFEAVAVDAASRLMSEISFVIDGSLPLEANLRHIGRSLAEVMQQREMIKLYRAVSAEKRNMPHISCNIYRMTRDVLLQPVSDYFQSCIDDGILQLETGQRAAEKYLTLALGGNQFLTTNPGPDSNDRQRNVEAALRTFLFGVTGGRKP